MKLAFLPRVAVICMLAGFLCSCASSNENLQRATAQDIGNTLTNDVSVSNVDRKVTSVSWAAKGPSGCYQCDADDILRRVHCVKVDCATGKQTEKK
jgi:hypothetical protein